MKKYSAVGDLSGRTEVGERVCEWTTHVRAVKRDNYARDPQDRDASPAQLHDLDVTEFFVHIHDADGNRVGSYDDVEAPSVEEQYWTAAITTAVKRLIAKGAVDDWDWEEVEPEPTRDGEP